MLPEARDLQFSVKGMVFGRECVHLISMIVMVYALALIVAASEKAVYLLLGTLDNGFFLVDKVVPLSPETFCLALIKALGELKVIGEKRPCETMSVVE